MRRAILTLSVVLIGAVFGSTALGSGFSVYEQGAKPSAQGGAFAARADDPSAIFYNPAGIAQLDGTRVYVGANGVALGSTTFESWQSNKFYKMQGNITGTPTMYFTHRLAEKAVVGLGVFTPFGLHTEWDDRFEGRFLARESKIRTIFVNPTIAFKLSKSLSVGLGVDWAWADMSLSRNIDFSAYDTLCDLDDDSSVNGSQSCGQGFTRMKGDSYAWGWNLGIRAETENGISYGLSWRSGVDLDFDDLEATFKETSEFAALQICGGGNGGPEAFGGGGASAVLPQGHGPSGCFIDQRATSALNLPQIVALGVGAKREKWDVEVNVVWHDWEAFESLDFDYEKETQFIVDTSVPQNWNSTLSYRVGGAWRLSKESELRGGLYIDDSPVPDRELGPMIPDSRRNSFQFGYGYTAESGGFRCDVYYQYINFYDNETTSQRQDLDGKYSATTNLIGLAATWIF